jgi:serine/threonine protein kinase/nitrous oxidase accessory protein NosD
MPLLAGRYRLVSKLGEGGMGVVHLAHDSKLERLVALKLLPAGSIHDAKAVERFQREARALAKLSHPGIVQAYDSGQDGAQHFLVMEYVEGRSLSVVLAEKGRIAPTRAADIGHQAALALHHAHQHGLVHRDVKPGNLLITGDGRLKLLDLGLARFLQDQIGEGALTREGMGMGTPDYAAPEQFRDARSADARSDIYALGCTLYHLVAGRPPFPGSSFYEKAEAHEIKEPAPLEEVCPEMPGGLALAIQRMMAKRPEDRFQSMAQAAESLAFYAAGSSASFQQFRRSTHWDGARLTATGRPAGRRRMAVAAGITIVMALLSFGLVGILLGWFHGTPATQVAGGSSASSEKSTETKLPQPPKAEIEDPNVLLVSQKPDGGGKYRTINEALAAVKPRQTIRVVDDAVYRERIALNRVAAFEGVTLEAVHGAQLEPDTVHYVFEISSVPNFTVTGFALRAQKKRNNTLIIVRGQCPNLRLTNLELTGDGHITNNGIEIVPGTASAAERSGIVIQRCGFRGLGIGVAFPPAGQGQVGGVAIRECRFTDLGFGVRIWNSVHDVQIVGNRFWGLSVAALQTDFLTKETRDVLISNNSCFECGTGLRVWDREVQGKLQIRNNLFLRNNAMDMQVLEADNPDQSRSPGNGPAVAQSFQFDHNWREATQPTGEFAKSWIPPSVKDVCQVKIDGIERDPKSADFLRPAKDSPLATQGAGNEDPSLPRYIGAVPPEGMEPWDWERAWRMPKDAQLLTVSQDEKGGGQYRSIGDALKDAKPWATIRVLDDGVYREGLVLNRPKMQEGITLEAFRAATLEAVAKGLPPLFIVGMPNATVRGFRLRARNQPHTTMLVVHSRCRGLRLERLEFTADRTVSTHAIEMLGDSGPDDETNPTIIRHCVFRGVDVAVGVHTDATDVASQVLIVGCEFTGCQYGIMFAGFCRHVGVMANRFAGITTAAIQFQGIVPETEDLLVVNNTCIDCGVSFRLWDMSLHGTRVRFRNNLFLASAVMDMQFVEGDNDVKGKGLGDGAAVAQLYHLDYNWRESAVRSEAKDWIPPSAKDVCQVKIEGLNRDSKSPEFLRPAKDSPLATRGAGNEDPSLPRYAGALPPEGTQPWDWERTWRMGVPKARPAK